MNSEFCFSRSEQHNNRVKNFMLDIMSPIIQEGDSLPQEILETILLQLVSPRKVSSLFAFYYLN